MLVVLLCSVGCKCIDPKQYPVRIKHPPPPPSTNGWRTVSFPLRTNLPNITVWNKINPIWWFQNADEPSPPPDYYPQSHWRETMWAFRNPFHNFTFYVIGVSDKEIVRSGRHPETINVKGEGWDFSVTKYKIWRLPIISYQKDSANFYFGWRVTGNFGVKINFKKNKKPW